VTVPFEFRSDLHCRIRRDPGSLDRRTSEHGSFDVKEARVKVTTVGSHGRERYQRLAGMVGNQVVEELISQGSFTILTVDHPGVRVTRSKTLDKSPWGQINFEV
jgi:hypothetical protein